MWQQGGSSSTTTSTPTRSNTSSHAPLIFLSRELFPAPPPGPTTPHKRSRCRQMRLPRPKRASPYYVGPVLEEKSTMMRQLSPQAHQRCQRPLLRRRARDKSTPFRQCTGPVNPEPGRGILPTGPYRHAVIARSFNHPVFGLAFLPKVL